MQAYSFVSYDGSGGVIPSTAGDPIVGVILETVATTDTDFTVARPVPYQAVRGFTFRLPVDTAASATAAMVGLPFDLHDETSLAVTAPGTQVVIRKFISATLVEVEVIDVA